MADRIEEVRCSYKGVCGNKKNDLCAIGSFRCSYQLFGPKPDEGRLLTDEEVTAWMVENGKSGFMGDYAREAQRDLTASIKDAYYDEVIRTAVLSRDSAKEAECQARIEALIEEIESMIRHSAGFDSPSGATIWFSMKYDDWEKFKATQKRDKE